MARKSKNRRQIQTDYSAEGDWDPTEQDEMDSSSEVTGIGDLFDQADDPGDLAPQPSEPSPGTLSHAGDVVDQRMVLDAVASNARQLERMKAQLDGLCEGMVSQLSMTARLAGSGQGAVDQPVEQPETDNTAELMELHQRIDQLESALQESNQQNRDLENQLASANIRETVETIVTSEEALSWEDRKQLILQQMEDDNFDSDEFVESLGQEIDAQPADSEAPADYVQRLSEELERRDQTINDLQHLLEQKAATAESGVSIGAAGIAQMIDSDELVREERERLQQLQTEWEEKFRQSEIEASLERAKLSRERRELAAKQSELERELERVRLKTLQQTEKDGPRKWLSQLGLAGS